MRQLAVVLALAAALAVAFAAPAAAHWSELAGYDVPDGQMADCLRVAGPGQLALLGRLTERTSSVDVLGVESDGIARRSTTALGWLTACAAVAPAARPDAPALLAAQVWRGSPARAPSALRAATAGARPVVLSGGGRVTIGWASAVATNARGAAVVAWHEHPLDARDPERERPPRLMVAVRRSSAASFGRPQLIGRRVDDDRRPVVAIDDAGRATVAWLGAAGGGDEDDWVAHLASAAEDGRFARPQPLVRVGSSTAGADVAVAPNGRALVVADGARGARAWERPPGARRFARAPVPSLGKPDELAVDVTADGAAVVAVRTGTGDGVRAWLRSPDASFGAEAELRPPDEYLTGLVGAVVLVPPIPTRRPRPPEDDGAVLDAALAPDGQVVVSWGEQPQEERAARVVAAHGTVANGFAAAQPVGGACRSANAIRPLRLRDGRLGVAWSDNARVRSLNDQDWQQSEGRVHVAAPVGAPAAQPAPADLGLTAERIGPETIAPGDPLQIRVRCAGGPCDVRALAVAHETRNGDRFGTGDVTIGASAAVPAGGAAELRFAPTRGTRFGEAGPTRPEIALAACLPGGPVVQRVRFSPQLRGLPERPLPRVRDLVARRVGSAVHVRWRVDRVEPGATFVVGGLDRTGDAVVSRLVASRGRARFAIALRGRAVRRVRRVDVAVFDRHTYPTRPVATRVRSAGGLTQ